MADHVDIGGECFTVTDAAAPTNGSYELVCKSKAKFNETFHDIIQKFSKTFDVVSLIRKYLPYGQDQLQGMVAADKDRLKNVISARILALDPIVNSQSQSVKNMQFSKYRENLKKLLIDIDKAGNTTTVTSPVVLQSKIKKIPREKLFYILLEMAWKLTHPTKIEPGTEDDWVKLLDTVEKLSLGDMVKSIQNIDNSSVYPMRVDMERVEKADDTIKDAASPPDAAIELRHRLEAIMTLLQTKKYLKSNSKNNTGPIVNANSIAKALPTSIQPNPISNKSLYAAMSPFYEYFTKKFGVISDLIPSATYPSLSDMATLLYISEQIAQTKKAGLYRVTNLDPTLLSFLGTQLNAINEYLKNDEKKEAFVEAAALLPAMSITSLINKFGSGTYNDPKTIPSLRFLIKGINLNHYENHEEMNVDNSLSKDEIRKALDEFIISDDLYIGYPESGVIPMIVFEVSYNNLDITKTIQFEEIASNYFTLHRSITLDMVMKVNTDQIYHQGMLALNMFEASKELLPK